MLKSKALLVLGHSHCGAVAGAADLNDAVARNVRAVIERIRAKSSLLRSAESAGELKIVGAVYDIASAKVTLL